MDKNYANGVVSEDVSRIVGKDAQRNNILAAKIIADIVKTTLGPKGMDKMLVNSNGDIIVTNDGATILEEMDVEHPIAKMIVEIAKTQEKEAGDGTTTIALVTGKLLENAERLLDRKIHPTLITKGYKMALEKSLEILNSLSINVSSREKLKQIAMTAMTGKGVEGNREYLAEILVRAMEKIYDKDKFEISDIHIEKIKGKNISESELIEGFVFEKERVNIEMPRKVENAKILLVDFPIELKNLEGETRITISAPEQLESFISSEEKRLKEVTQKIIDSGANVVFCQKGIDDVAQYYLAKAGIFACRRVTRTEIEKISKATSAKIISNINDFSEEKLGEAAIVEEVKEYEQSFIYIKGCKNTSIVTILVRGGTEHIIEEAERALKDGIGDINATLKNGKIVAGGGAIEIELAKRLRSFAKTISGREQLVIEEFANAIETIPETLAENAGLEPIEVIAELRKRHEANNFYDGLNLISDRIENCIDAGIIEPLKIKTQAISSATELSIMILRIDDVLMSVDKKKKKEDFNKEDELTYD